MANANGRTTLDLFLFLSPSFFPFFALLVFSRVLFIDFSSQNFSAPLRRFSFGLCARVVSMGLPVDRYESRVGHKKKRQWERKTPERGRDKAKSVDALAGHVCKSPRRALDLGPRRHWEKRCQQGASVCGSRRRHCALCPDRLLYGLCPRPLFFPKSRKRKNGIRQLDTIAHFFVFFFVPGDFFFTRMNLDSRVPLCQIGPLLS